MRSGRRSAHHRSGASLSRRGSTLIELMIVLAILALLLALVVPALTAVPLAPQASEKDSLRAVAVRSGAIQRSVSFVAFPDGRVIARGAIGAE